VKEELHEHAREKFDAASKKKSMTVYCKPYFKDTSGLVSLYFVLLHVQRCFLSFLDIDTVG